MEQNGQQNVKSERKQSHKQKAKEYFTTKRITYIAVFSAMSIVLYMFAKFSLPIFPAFLDFQVSDMPALICAFMFGPLAGCSVVAIKILMKLPFTSTMCVGELCDLSLGLVFVLSASLIYKLFRSNKGAILGLTVGVFATTAMALLINRFIIVPFYALIIPGGWNTIIGMTAAVKEVVGVYAEVTRESFYSIYLPYAVLPFNLLRGFTCALLSFLLFHGLKRADQKLLSKR